LTMQQQKQQQQTLQSSPQLIKCRVFKSIDLMAKYFYFI